MSQEGGEAAPAAANSTIYVNRIPKEVTEEELRGLFQSNGTIESVRFAGGRFNRRPGSASTRYAFIKFSHPDEAAGVLEFHQQLSLHDSVLDIELATPMGPRPRNRRRNPRPENGAAYSNGGDHAAADSGLKSVQQQLARLQRQEAQLTKFYREQHAFFTSQIASLKKHLAGMRQGEDDVSGDEGQAPPGQFQDGGGDYN